MATTFIRKAGQSRSQTTKTKEDKEQGPVNRGRRPDSDELKLEKLLQTVNVKGLSNVNFQKLLVLQGISPKISEELTQDLKNEKSVEDRLALKNVVVDFSKSGKVPDVDLSQKSPNYALLYKRLARELSDLAKTSTLQEVEDIPEKIPKEILKKGGDFESKSGKKLTFNVIKDKVPTNPVGSTFAPVEQMPSKIIQGISDAKPTAGQKSIEEQQNPAPTDDPSKVNSASGKVEMGNNGNTIVMTAMQGNQELYNPESLANTKNDPIISNGGSASVGIPTNPVAPDLNNRNKQEQFVAGQTENGNVKNSSGQFERKENTNILVPLKTGIASLDQANAFKNEQEYNEFLQSQGLPIIPPVMGPEKPISSTYKPIGGSGLTFAVRPQAKGAPNSELEQAIRDAEMANAKLRKLKDLEQADSDKKQIAQIGNRSNTGLATRVSVAGTDIMTKPIDEVFKSINAFSNRSWIAEGARNESTLGKNSSLQKMHDMADEERYADTFTPVLYMQRDVADIVNDYKHEFRRTMGKRMIPQYDSSYIQERIPQYAQGLNFSRRPVGSRNPTFDNVYDWTYDHCCVVGTQNMGLSPAFPEMAGRIDYEGNPIVFPNTMYERETGVRKYF